MKVLKFGGTSVGSSKNIKKVIEILKKSSEAQQIAVVVSAVGGITDKLIKALRSDNGGEYKSTVFKKYMKEHETLERNRMNFGCSKELKTWMLH